MAQLGTLFSAEKLKGGAGRRLRTRAASFPVLSRWVARVGFGRCRSGSSTPANRRSGLSCRRVASSLARHTSSPMQRRDDPAARLTRSSGRSCSKDPSGAHPSVRLTPSRPSPLPHRSRGGGGGPRGGARASPATQPPPLLPPSTPGPDATVVGSAPTPLLPPSATAAAKMEPENKYLPELMAEKDSLDPSFTHAMQLLSVGKRVSAYLRVSRYWRWVAAALFLLPPLRSSGICTHSPTPAQGVREAF